MAENNISSSIEKEIKTVESKLEKLADEMNRQRKYLIFLKERKRYLSEVKETPTSVPLPMPQSRNANHRKFAEQDPRTDMQYKITIMFISLLFITLMVFFIVGGIEGAKTAWLLLGPMLSVMIYSLFKGSDTRCSQI